MPRPALPEATLARRFVAASSCLVVVHADSVEGLAGGSWRRGSDGERAWGVGKPGDGSAHYRSRSSSSPPVSMGSPNSTSSSSPDLAAILEYLTAVLEYVTTVLTLRGSCAVLLDLDLCPISTFFSISIWLLRLFWIWFGYVLWLLTWFPCQESLQTSATAPPLPGLPGGPAVADIQTTKPIPFFSENTGQWWFSLLHAKLTWIVSYCCSILIYVYVHAIFICTNMLL